MSLAAVTLESFAQPARQASSARPAGIDPAEHARALSRAAAEAHARGYEEGAAAALAAREAELELLLAGIAETLADRAVTGREARAAAERALEPLLLAVIRAIAPELARAGLPGEIAARLGQIVAAAPESCIRIDLAPEMAGPVHTALSGAGVPEGRVEIRPDPGCPALEARIGWADGIDRIAPGTAAGEVLASLARAFGDAPADPARAAG